MSAVASRRRGVRRANHFEIATSALLNIESRGGSQAPVEQMKTVGVPQTCGTHAKSHSRIADSGLFKSRVHLGNHIDLVTNDQNLLRT
jgi:hypothetical protein